MGWFMKNKSGESDSDDQSFCNGGNTKREREVAKLLAGRLAVPAQGVRFSGSGDDIVVSVDTVIGYPLAGGNVKASMSAVQQAEAIVHHVKASLDFAARLGGRL
jgi:hypothetical protein